MKKKGQKIKGEGRARYEGTGWKMNEDEKRKKEKGNGVFFVCERDTTGSTAENLTAGLPRVSSEKTD